MGTPLEYFGPTQYTVLNWFMWSIGFLLTILRLGVRYHYMKRIYWEDTWAVFGLVALSIMAILNQVVRDDIYLFVTIYNGGPPPPQYTSPAAVEAAVARETKIQFAFMMIFWACLWSCKASLLVFYRKLFINLTGYMKWWWAVVGICFVTFIMSVLTNILTCVPLHTRWTVSANHTECPISHGINAIYVATAVDIFTDVLIALLPIRILLGLRLKTQQKVGIGAVFSLGIIIIAFSVVRMVKIADALAGNRPTGSVNVALWSILESTMAVVVGSLPTLKSVIVRRGATSYNISTEQETRSIQTPGAMRSDTSYLSKAHVLLYTMKSTKNKINSIRQGYDSDDASKSEGNDSMGGIMRTKEVIISRSASGAGGDHEVVYHV